MREWRRHCFYTTQTVRTTWKLRAAIVIAVGLTAVLTRGVWATGVGGSLACAGELAPSDMILVENFDPNYLVFERAAALQKAGFAPRAVVPIQAYQRPGNPNPVASGIAELMATHARMANWVMVPIGEREPISLNAAAQISRHLAREHVRSVIVVAPGFRSRRSALVYNAVLADLGIRVQCAPVFRPSMPDGWMDTWHGVQEVTQEFLKLQYYRFYVLPFVAPSAAAPADAFVSDRAPDA